VEFISRSLRTRGFSERSTRAILNVHRASTRTVYDIRWRIFHTWCGKEGISPQTITTPQIADFLVYLRDIRKLRGGTIAGYLSVITSVRVGINRTGLSSSPELSAIIRGFKQDDLRSHFRPPEWDLSLVLRCLCRTPYEPLRAANIVDLTRKTIFLLAFATAARVSELHALDFRQVRFEEGGADAAYLGLLLNFVAKNQGPGQPPREFKVSALSSILGPEDVEDNLLCPVRALRRYMAVTRYATRKSDRLFISCRPERTTDISKNTVAFWLKGTILAAYRSVGRPPPSSHRPHEIRALAATMSLQHNIPVTQILKGCFWAAESTFSSHYLRNLSVLDVEGVHRLGPLIAAQSVINANRTRP
jgi:hypothetical protein